GPAGQGHVERGSEEPSSRPVRVPIRLTPSRVPLPVRPPAREHPADAFSPPGCTRRSSGGGGSFVATAGKGTLRPSACLGHYADLAKASGTLSGTRRSVNRT